MRTTWQLAPSTLSKMKRWMRRSLKRLDLKWKFVIIKTFQKSLTRQLSEAVRIKQRGEDMVLNKKGV